MDDMTEDFQFLKQLKKERHAKWKEDNTNFLFENGMIGRFRIVNNGEAILFREEDYPMVDFYPSTGRWRIPGQKKTYSGGAEKFMNWYEKQKGK